MDDQRTDREGGVLSKYLLWLWLACLLTGITLSATIRLNDVLSPDASQSTRYCFIVGYSLMLVAFIVALVFMVAQAIAHRRRKN